MASSGSSEWQVHRAPDDTPLRRYPVSPLSIAGIVLPLAIVIFTASRQPLAFDGAMNMQVAENLARGGGYARTYGVTTLFPAEIQTSAYFLFLTAAAIRLFGTSNLTLQAANVAFALLLLIGISLSVRESKWARLIAPGFILFATPGLLRHSLGGYGEGAIAALAIITFLLISQLVASERRQTLRLALAFTSIGFAITIKTIAVAIVPAALVGIIIALRMRPSAAWKKLSLAPLFTLGPIAAFELYRLYVLRGSYAKYWSDQLHEISGQAVGGTFEKHGLGSYVAKIADHFHLLAVQTGVAAEWWVVLILLVVVGSILAFIVVSRSEASSSQRRQLVLLAQLVTYATFYLAWWLAVTPTAKTWLRRATPGLFALTLAAVVLAVLVVPGIAKSMSMPRVNARAFVGSTWLAVGSLLLVLAASSIPDSEKAVADNASADDLASLSGTVSDLHDEGDLFFGSGWWSAPVVGLYSGVDIYDIQQVDVCAAPFKDTIVDGDAYLVWDFYAVGLSRGLPKVAGLTFTDTSITNSYGSLKQISLDPTYCPAG